MPRLLREKATLSASTLASRSLEKSLQLLRMDRRTQRQSTIKSLMANRKSGAKEKLLQEVR